MPLGEDNRINGVTYNQIVATRNASDFNSIRELMNSITDATYLNQYLILIPKGRWFECDIQGKEFITLVGEDKNETVLYCDGNSTKVTPLDYSFGGQGGKPLNTVSKMNKHVIFAFHSLNVENLTIEGKEIKYPIHADNNATYDLKFYKCIITLMESGDESNLVGVGLWGLIERGQTLTFDRCNFRRKDKGRYACFIHTWNNQNYPCKVTFKNSTFENCSFASIQDLGSNQHDVISFDNCVCDYQKYIYYGGDFGFWLNSNGDHVTSFDAFPYSLWLNYTNTEVENVYPYNGWETQKIVLRPLYLNYINK